MDPVIVPLNAIDEDELEEFIERMRNLTHATITINRQFVLSSDSPSVLNGLQALFGEVIAPRTPPTQLRKNGHKPPKRHKVIQVSPTDRKPEPKRGPHVRSIKILNTGELISRFELEKRMAEKTILPGTMVHSPKHGDLRVGVAEDGAYYVAAPQEDNHD